MTAVAKISLPLAAVALVAALLVPLLAPLGAAPSINLSLPSAQTVVEDDDFNLGLVEVRHTNKDHSPGVANSVARLAITQIMANWATFLMPGPEGPQVRCGAVKDSGGAVIRGVVYIVGGSLKGFMAIFNPANPTHPWVSGYMKDSGRSFDQGPDPNKMAPGHTWDPGFPCPDVLPTLQAASN